MTDLKELAEITITIISFMVVFANLFLLSALLRNFYRSYRSLKAKFVKGLIFFVSFLLIQQFFFLLGLIVINAFRATNPGGPIFLLNVMELIALIIFYRTTGE